MLSHQPFHGGGGLERVAVREGSTLYVRIVPERFSGKPQTAAAVHDWRGPDGNGGIQSDSRHRPDGLDLSSWPLSFDICAPRHSQEANYLS